MDSPSQSDNEDNFEPDVEPGQELASDVAVSIQNLPKELAELPDVKQFAEYINKHLVLGDEEYTAKNWQEFVVTDNRKMLGFGRPGAWYQYLMQQRDRLIFNDELQKSNLASHAELANVRILHRGIAVTDVNWKNMDESFDCDPPHFNHTEFHLELKINVPDHGYVLLLIEAEKYERYRSARAKIGENFHMGFWVIESTISEFESMSRSLVADHEEMDYDDYYEATDPLPIWLNAEFFTELASLLKMERETLFSSLLNFLQYPFSEVDWDHSWEDEKADEITRPPSYEHIQDEIKSKVGLTSNFFQSGYLETTEHVLVLDYLAKLVHKKVFNEHAKAMTLLSIECNGNYSAATELISKRTYWHSVSESLSWYEMDIVDAQGKHECSVHVKLMLPSKYSFNYDGSRMVIIITNVADETLQKQISETFEQWQKTVSKSDKSIESNEFSVSMSFPTYEGERDELLLRALANQMHFNDWNMVEFWRFLLDVTTLDEDGIGDGDLFMNSYDDSCDDDTSASDVSDAEAMELDEEVNEIKMSAEITSQNGRPKRTKKTELRSNQ